MVRYIEALALEDNAHRTDNAPDITTANRALGQRIIGHALLCFKLMIALIASIKISWHCDNYPRLEFQRLV